MPLGTIHTIVGVLERRNGDLVIIPDEGGCWRLDVNHKLSKLVGQRVRIIGARDGFDLLYVQSAAPT